MGDPVCQRPAAWWEPPVCDTVLCHQSVGSACGRRPGPTTTVPGSSSRDTEAGISLGGTDACLTDRLLPRSLPPQEGLSWRRDWGSRCKHLCREEEEVMQCGGVAEVAVGGAR